MSTTQNYHHANGNGNHAEPPAVSPESVAEYLKSLLDGRPLATMPNVLLCRDAKIRLDDDGVGLVREYLKANRETPDYAEWHGAIEAALNPPPPKRRRISLKEALQWERIEPIYAFNKQFLIRPGGINLIWGNYGIGKSYVSATIALELACKGMTVDYYALQDLGAEFVGRFATWIAANEKPIPETLNLLGGEGFALDVTKLGDIELLKTELEWMPNVAVIDMISDIAGEADFVDYGQMGEVMLEARKLAETVVYIHHSNKTGFDYLGSQAIGGSVSTEYEIKNAGGCINVVNRKNRYGAKLPTFSLALQNFEDFPDPVLMLTDKPVQEDKDSKSQADLDADIVIELLRRGRKTEWYPSAIKEVLASEGHDWGKNKFARAITAALNNYPEFTDNGKTGRGKCYSLLSQN